MKRKISKFLILFSLSVVLIIASSPFVSAVVSNGAIITGLSSSYIRMNSTTDYYSPTVTQNGYSITNSYQISGVITNLIDTYNRLEFKCTNNYGLLKMTIYSLGGSPYHSEASIINWNGLYNTDTGVKLASASVEADSFSVMYEGYIPTYIEFRGYFTVDSPGDVLQSFVVCNIEFFPMTDPNIATNDDIIANQDKNADKITQNQDKNTDKIINAGSDTAQPDFNSTNGKLDDTVGQIESIEGSYQIDEVSTGLALTDGTAFLQGSDMQRASIQVKTWIERFSSENRVISGFLVAAMVLGLCFWVIGRKAWSK